jgi:hypothetical protein
MAAADSLRPSTSLATTIGKQKVIDLRHSRRMNLSDVNGVVQVRPYHKASFFFVKLNVQITILLVVPTSNFYLALNVPNFPSNDNFTLLA